MPKPLSYSVLSRLLRKLPAVTVHKSRFSRHDAFHRAGCEFAHFHSEDEVDLRLTWPKVKVLREVHAGRPGFWFRKGKSDWLEVDRREADPRLLRDLIKEAHAVAK